MNTSENSCQFCRSKKVKCDRLLPKCSRCEKLSADCIYKEKLRSGPKKRKLDLPIENPIEITESVTNINTPFPGMINNLNPSINQHHAITQQHSSVSVARSAPNLHENNGMSIFDVIPLPAVQFLIKFFTSVPSSLSSLGITKEYLLSLLHKDKYLLVSGALTISCIMNLDYKKYFDNMYRFFQYQFTKVDKHHMDSLEYLQALRILTEIKFQTFQIRSSLNVLSEAVNQMEHLNFQLVDLVPEEERDLSDVNDNSSGRKRINNEIQITDLKRRLYWSFYSFDKRITFSTAISGKVRLEEHYVDLPDSKVNLTHINKIIFNEEDGLSEKLVKAQCKSLTIQEYHYILLSKSEEIALWFRSLDYIKKVRKVKEMKQSIFTQYHHFRKSLDRLQSTFHFTEEEMNSFAFFSKIEIVLVCLKLVIRQSFIEVLDSITKKNDYDVINSQSIQKELMNMILIVKDKITLDEIPNYHYDISLIFYLYEVLKILAFYSNEVVVSERNADLVALSNKIVTIITKVAYEYENEVAKKILEEYNSKLEKNLIQSLFYKDGLVDREDLSHFQDFINAELYA